MNILTTVERGNHLVVYPAQLELFLSENDHHLTVSAILLGKLSGVFPEPGSQHEGFVVSSSHYETLH